MINLSLQPTIVPEVGAAGGNFPTNVSRGEGLDIPRIMFLGRAGPPPLPWEHSFIVPPPFPSLLKACRSPVVLTMNSSVLLHIAIVGLRTRRPSLGNSAEARLSFAAVPESHRHPSLMAYCLWGWLPQYFQILFDVGG